MADMSEQWKQWQLVYKHGDMDQQKFIELEKMMSAKRHMKYGLVLMAVWFLSGLLTGIIIASGL
jgi:hypothetical protein